MDKVVYVDENGKVKGKLDELKEKVKNQWDKTVAFCKEHKEGVITAATVAVPAIIEITKMTIKNCEKRAEDDHRRREIWDPVEGHWWKLRRELTSREQLELEFRVKNGESRGEVLDDMGVLRR